MDEMAWVRIRENELVRQIAFLSNVLSAIFQGIET